MYLHIRISNKDSCVYATGHDSVVPRNDVVVARLQSRYPSSTHISDSGEEHTVTERGSADSNGLGRALRSKGKDVEAARKEKNFARLLAKSSAVFGKVAGRGGDDCEVEREGGTLHHHGLFPSTLPSRDPELEALRVDLSSLLSSGKSGERLIAPGT